jgi:Protein of unknown function, DUF488
MAKKRETARLIDRSRRGLSNIGGDRTRCRTCTRIGIFQSGSQWDMLCCHFRLRVGRERVLIVRKVKAEMPAVFTIGHSTHTWKDFLDLLRAHRIKRVIDIRSIPRSRHNPQFNRETLSTKLRAARIGYVHLRKLGGLRHARRDSLNKGWRNTSFRGFADYMQTSEFEAGLDRLMKLAGQKRSAIMCAEAVPWRCHRSLIADALTVRGIRVDDIMSMKRHQVHSLISFAHVQGHRITYPVGNRGGGRRI